jgi:hypothetical protein
VLREGHAAEKLALEERVAYLEATLGDKEQDCQELEEALAELEEEKKQEMARFANEQQLVRLELESKLLIQVASAHLCPFWYKYPAVHVALFLVRDRGLKR